MSYFVKEIFYTLQGEGRNAGRPSVFCRFTGCNMWSGLERDKSASACYFCDTDFVGTDGEGGGKFKTARELAAAINAQWPENTSDKAKKYVVLTGGEPTLQLDAALINELKQCEFEIAIETNGTKAVPAGVDWITVSPKSIELLTQKSGSELKLLFPFEIRPEQVADLQFDYYYLSPINVTNREQSKANLLAAIDYCKANPQWRLTIQMHKVVEIP